jgi:hypothetical protein
MSLEGIKIPAEIKTGIQDYLADWSRAAPSHLALPRSRPRLLLPHRLYRYLGERQRDKAHLALVKPVGWRCFVRTASLALIAVDAFESKSGFGFRIHMGRNTERWMDLIRRIRLKKRWDSDRYAMRTLLAPATYDSALWFAGSHGSDQLFALDWKGNGLSAARWITAAEWEESVDSAASHAAELWRKARESSLSLQPQHS